MGDKPMSDRHAPTVRLREGLPLNRFAPIATENRFMERKRKINEQQGQVSYLKPPFK
jgi:hypothetical protein